jgi:ribose transport system permease protein
VSASALSVSRLQARLGHLAVPTALLAVLLVACLVRRPQLLSSEGLAGAVIVLAPLVLGTLAITPIALVGRGSVDLSVGPLIGFINVTLVKWLVENGVQSPVTVFGFVVLVGVLYQLLLAVVIIYVRVAPIIVALSGYLVLTGVNLVVLQRPSGAAPDFMTDWGSGVELLSPVLYVVLSAVALWFLFTRTGFFRQVRLTGADERMSFASGVRTRAVRIGAHMIGGVFAGLSALTYTALIGSGDPTQGNTYTLQAVTALVLGGTSLAGGSGGGLGSILGAVSMYLISYFLATFDFGNVSGFVSQLAFGLILMTSMLLSVALSGRRPRLVGGRDD